jgi:F-type H+-transporting ATPase subunit epsilon
MNEKIEINILTPGGEYLKQDVTMAVIPGQMGEIGVLPQHITLVTSLNPGLVHLYDGNKIIKSIFIYGGFAQIYNNKLYVLTNNVQEKSQLNSAIAKERLRKCNDQLSEMGSQPELQMQLRKEIDVYQKIVEITQG